MTSNMKYLRNDAPTAGNKCGWQILSIDHDFCLNIFRRKCHVAWGLLQDCSTTDLRQKHRLSSMRQSPGFLSVVKVLTACHSQWRTLKFTSRLATQDTAQPGFAPITKETNIQITEMASRLNVPERRFVMCWGVMRLYSAPRCCARCILSVDVRSAQRLRHRPSTARGHAGVSRARCSRHVGY